MGGRYPKRVRVLRRICGRHHTAAHQSRHHELLIYKVGILSLSLVFFIHGIRDEDPVLFSTDPDLDPDPTCNNGFIKLFLS